MLIFVVCLCYFITKEYCIYQCDKSSRIKGILIAEFFYISKLEITFVLKYG